MQGNVTLEHLKACQASFAEERDWQQFHTPRNLLLALTGEVGELAELFQWRSDVQAQPLLPGFTMQEKAAVADELADVLLYVVRLSDVCGVDLGQAALSKIAKNAAKYPAERCRGSAAKYHAYADGASAADEVVSLVGTGPGAVLLGPAVATDANSASLEEPAACKVVKEDAIMDN